MKLIYYFKTITNLLSGLFKKKPQTLYEKAKSYGNRVAKETNHRYKGLGYNYPYSYHYDMCEKFIEPFMYLIPEKHRETVKAALRVHDSIEDHRQTYNDVKKALGTQVADIAYACTNEKGKNRAQRANDKYYHDMKLVPFAEFVKLADRGGNVLHSVELLAKGRRAPMFKVYQKEYPNFASHLSNERFKPVLDEIKRLLEISTLEKPLGVLLTPPVKTPVTNPSDTNTRKVIIKKKDKGKP